jgi:hypothetical protein
MVDDGLPGVAGWCKHRGWGLEGGSGRRKQEWEKEEVGGSSVYMHSTMTGRYDNKATYTAALCCSDAGDDCVVGVVVD